jgi:hypothetical protein
MGWFVGNLTGEQLSRMAVVSWPYGVRLLFIAGEILQQTQAPGSASPTLQGSPSQSDVRADLVRFGQSV